MLENSLMFFKDSNIQHKPCKISEPDVIDAIPTFRIINEHDEDIEVDIEIKRLSIMEYFLLVSKEEFIIEISLY